VIDLVGSVALVLTLVVLAIRSIQRTWDKETRRAPHGEEPLDLTGWRHR